MRNRYIQCCEACVEKAKSEQRNLPCLASLDNANYWYRLSTECQAIAELRNDILSDAEIMRKAKLTVGGVR